MKKILYILFNLILLAYMLFALGFSNSRQKEMLCTELKINMKDTLNSGFLTKLDIERILLSEDKEILGYPIRGINTRKLERKLRELAYIKEAEIYGNLNGVLKVDITQRTPLIRIITSAQNTYYLDREGYIFPSATGFTPHVLIANGYFKEDKTLTGIKSLQEIVDHEKFSEWNEAMNLAVFIKNDKFWQSQIVQIYLNRNGDFELIPRVGAHQIIFGDSKDMEMKFKKLKTLYKEGLAYEGWNKYEMINLKYNNQVICTKR